MTTDVERAQIAREIGFELRDRPLPRIAGSRPMPVEPLRPEAILEFRAAVDVMMDPAPIAIVEGVAWQDSITVHVAESGAAKTFLQIDLAATVAAVDVRTWHGRRVQSGSVAYVSFEGDALSVRLRALVEHADRELDHLHILRATEPLSPRLTRDGEERSAGEIYLSRQLEALTAVLAERCAPGIVLVVVDTVRASLAGNEDSSEHASAYLRSIRRLMALTPGAAWILAHHAGWQDSDSPRKRERGSSAWRGNCDATLYLEAGAYDTKSGEAPLTLRALKVRDGEPPAPLALIRRRVELAAAATEDLRDGPLTSCIIVADRRSREERDADAAEAAAAKQQAIDLRVLRAIREYPSATNLHALQQYLGLGYPIVRESVTRLLQGDHVLLGARNQPYQVTPSGVQKLANDPSVEPMEPSGTERNRAEP